MQDRLATELLSTMATGVYSTRDLIRLSDRSPNTVIRYLGELEAQGLIERVSARRFGPGRPQVIGRLTPLGLAQLRSREVSTFLQLHRGTGALWGPRRSFSFWGVPLVGKSDIFVKKNPGPQPFDIVVQRNPDLYHNSFASPEGPYPSLERFLAWAAGAENPRYLASAAVLLKHVDSDPGILLQSAKKFRTVNRVGFLSDAVGAKHIATEFPRNPEAETMLKFAAPIDPATARIARSWRVRNPLSISLIREMDELYGAPSRRPPT